jgi:membrane fusion protein (multidrug efflux system)
MKKSNDLTPRAKTVYLLMKNFPRFIVLLLIVAIIFLFVSMGAEKKRLEEQKSAAKTPEQPPVNVVVHPLVPSLIQDRINLPGVIEPWLHLNLLSKLNGTVEEVLVSEGDHIKQGDIIARIEDADYRIALEMAESSYNLARSEYKRDLSMFDKGIVSSSELESRKSRLQTTKSDVEQRKLQLTRCKILSPMDGVITKLSAKTGLLLNVADPVAEIVQIDQLKAVIGIPETDVARVSDLERIDLTIKALDNLKKEGTKHFFSPTPDSSARLYNLELKLENPTGKILPGMFVRAAIIKQRITDAMVVPLYSVISRNEHHFVFIAEDGVAVKKAVQLGYLEGWKVHIKEGLNTGDLVLVEGQRGVEDGQRINIIRTLDSLESLLP